MYKKGRSQKCWAFWDFYKCIYNICVLSTICIFFRPKAFIFNYTFNTFWHTIHQLTVGIMVKSSPFILYSLSKLVIIFLVVFHMLSAFF